MTGYLPDTDSYQTIPSQSLYMNTLPGTAGISVPVAESTPVPQVGPTLLGLFSSLNMGYFGTFSK